MYEKIRDRVYQFLVHSGFHGGTVEDVASSFESQRKCFVGHISGAQGPKIKVLVTITVLVSIQYKTAASILKTSLELQHDGCEFK